MNDDNGKYYININDTFNCANYLEL